MEEQRSSARGECVDQINEALASGLLPAPPPAFFITLCSAAAETPLPLPFTAVAAWRNRLEMPCCAVSGPA